MGGVGTLSIGGATALNLQAGELRINIEEIDQFSSLAVGTATVTLSSGAQLVLTLNCAPEVGDVFKILAVGGTTAIVGNFAGNDSVTATYNGVKYGFSVLYNSALGGGDGNDIVLRCTGRIGGGTLFVVH